MEDDEAVDESTQSENICNICGTNGHDAGNCATAYKIIKLKADHYMERVELYTSLEKWQVGREMNYNKSENLFKLYKHFPVGKHEFKFKVNGKLWMTSSFFPKLMTKDENVNNYIIVKPFVSEEFTVVREAKEAGKVEVKFILTIRSVKMMMKDLRLPMRESTNIEMLGSWDNWSKGERFITTQNRKGEDDIWVIRKKLKKQYYEYKFRVNGQWILDMFRESTISNGIDNHFLDIPHMLETDSKKGREIKLKLKDSYKIEFVQSETLNFFQLYGHSMNAIGNGIYIYGGFCRDSFINSILKLNPDDMEVEVHEMYDKNSPQRICFHATVKYGQKLIIYGGSNESKIDNKYYTYDTENNSWTGTKLNDSIPPRELFSIVHRKRTYQMYVFGGYYCSPDLEVETNLNDLYILHLDRLTFEEINAGNAPEPRCNHRANFIDNVMYIFGGCRIDYLDKIAFGDMHKINLNDPEDCSWEEIKFKGRSPEARFGHLSLDLGPYIFVNGGMTTSEFGKERLFWDLWVFNTKNENWSEINLNGNEKELARVHHSGCFWEKNIFIFGGKFNKNAKQYK